MPAAVPAGDREEEEAPPDDDGPIKALDPAVAAVRRARFRQAASRLILQEHGSMDDSIEAAEESYEEPEEVKLEFFL